MVSSSLSLTTTASSSSSSTHHHHHHHHSNHTIDLDIYNPEAKHISKQAGLTPEERESHSLLLTTNFQDAFRFFYPGAINKS
jgi:hypothetical protein